jgi:phosphatidylserine decarboxylase
VVPKLASYGRDVIAVVVISCVILVLLSFFPIGVLPKVILDVLALFAGGFTLFFFRDPDRTPQALGSDIILSPADGKVMFIGEVNESEFLNSNGRMVSIFMSPMNVHVNRIPVNGTVRFLKYIKGEYLVAFDEKSSERNERMLIGIESGDDRILIRQVAGFIARRIVCELSENQRVEAGDRFGMIKFGSRVDVILPLDCDLKVKLNEKVVAGSTVIGSLRND